MSFLAAGGAAGGGGGGGGARLTDEEDSFRETNTVDGGDGLGNRSRLGGCWLWYGSR